MLPSAGPTTASRMDKYTPRLLEMGLKGIVGKGGRGPIVREALKQHTAVYMAALGGGWQPPPGSRGWWWRGWWPRPPASIAR